MDPNQTPPFPPQTGDIPSVVNPTPTPPIDTGGTPPVTATPTGRGRTPKGLIATIFGLLLLVGGVGAGLILVRQQQDIREKAATPTTLQCPSADGTCFLSNGKQGTCYWVDYWCPNGTTGGCQENGLNIGGGSANEASLMGSRSGFAACGVEQLDMGCKANDGSGAETIPGGMTWQAVTSECTGGTTGGGTTTQPGWGPCGQCFGSGDCVMKLNNEGPTHPQSECQARPDGTCAWNPAVCGGGGGGPAPTPKPACGSACTQTSDCAPAANGGTVTCVSGICQNAACIGKTIPGANCDCSALNNCGQPCGASVGLCQTGSTCRYINGPNCGITSSSNPSTYCVPATLPTGWTTANCVARDQGNSYVLNAGANPTAAEVQAACAPATASCAGLTAYDTNWNALSAAQLSQLKAGDKVRFTVAGTTTNGVFDKARFTINGTQRAEVTGKRPSSADFYDEYTVPAGTTSFTVSAQVHHAALNQWY